MSTNTGLRVVAISVKEASDFLAKHDRHYKAPVEEICAIGVAEKVPMFYPATGETKDTLTLRGAAILGKRDSSCAELAHIYVDGTSQGYSLLYGACWRALKALGYDKAVL